MTRQLKIETLEARKLLAADLLLASDVENYLADQVTIPVEVATDQHGPEDHHEDDDEHDQFCCCSACRGLDPVARNTGSSGDWNPGTARGITHTVTVQPVVVSNSDGSNTAGYFGNASQEAAIKEFIDQIWAQAGIDVDWLQPNFWNNTTANVGNGSANNRRPTGDLTTIVNSGDSAGVGSSDPLILDMYFVEISAGFTLLGDNYANGLAFLGGNGSTLHVGDSLVSWTAGQQTAARVVAHEIGHNLGLGHVIDDPNLMDDGELLTSSQISTTLASSFSVPLPANRSPVVSSAIPDQSASVNSPDVVFNLANRFSDPDGDALTYTVSVSGDSATGSISNGVLTLDYVDGRFGETQISVTASDGRGESVTDVFEVTVEAETFTADFNGDQQDDLLVWSGGKWLLVSSPSGQEAAQLVGGWANTVEWTNVGIGDFNGDGRDDVVGRTGGQWWLGISTGTSIVTQYWGSWSPNVAWQNVSIADFNDDGLSDIAGREGGNWWIAVSNGSTFQTQYWGSWSHLVDWQDVSFGDYNNDGRTDIAGREGGNWWIATSTGSSLQTSYWGSWAYEVAWEDVSVGDFNGDGFADLAGRTSGNWWVSLSNGSRFQNQYWGAWSNAVNWEDAVAADVDGDGDTDILARTGGGWWLAQANGSTFNTTYWNGWVNSDWSSVSFGDFDGNGALDLSALYLGNHIVYRT